MSKYYGRMLLIYLTLIAMGIFFCEIIGHNLRTRGQELIVPRETSERVLLYEYKNSKIVDLGNGQKRFTMQMAVSYNIYRQGDKIINESKLGAVEYSINDMENYIGKANGSGWEDIINNVNTDSIVYDINTDFDISADSLVRFKKKGITVLRLMNVKGFDGDGKDVKLASITKADNKIVYKFEEEVKTVDPTWSWTPPSGEGNDTWISLAAPTTNYDEHMNALAFRPDSLYILIEFPGLVDSIGLDAIINSATCSIYCVLVNKTGGDFTAFFTPLTEIFDEATVTFNTKPDSIGNTTYNSDTLSTTVLGATEWWVYNIERSVQAFVDGTISSFGWEIKSTTAHADLMFTYNEDSENSKSSGKLPIITIDYISRGAVLTIDTLNAFTIEATFDTSGHSLAPDSFKVLDATDSSAFGKFIIPPVLKDTIDTLTANTQYILIGANYLADTIWSYTNKDTVTTPVYSFDLTTDYIDTNSLEITLDTSGVGYWDSAKIVLNKDTATVYVGFQTVLKDSIDTLSINTLYDFIAVGYYKNRLIAYSDAGDSIYTDAQPADVDSLSWVTDSSFIFILDPKNNPAWTLYSVLDSQRASQGSTNYYLDPDTTHFMASGTKRTYAHLGSALGTTFSVYSKYLLAGDTLKIYVRTHSGDSLSWGL